MKIPLNSKIPQHAKGKVYGTTTVGARGQVVIPAEARKDMHLHSGDKLVVTSRFGKVLALIKANQVEGLISMIVDNISDGDDKEAIRKHLKRVFVKTSK